MYIIEALGPVALSVATFGMIKVGAAASGC
jgi:hypothetical protein